MKCRYENRFIHATKITSKVQQKLNLPICGIGIGLLHRLRIHQKGQKSDLTRGDTNATESQKASQEETTLQALFFTTADLIMSMNSGYRQERLRQLNRYRTLDMERESQQNTI